MDKIDESYRERFRELMRQNLPHAKLDLVEVRAGENFDGEPSLFVKLVFAAKPADADFRALRAVLRAFRTWLADEKADKRFPYIEVSTRAEERSATAASHDRS
ncbi:MAG TPA: hypothetical protein VMV31_06465 [Terriglobales bacterium]|nr:hypothetical protein [Terriglobales bacterium]